jgi:hypothetical protein
MVYHYTTIETFYNMLATFHSSDDKEHLEFWASCSLNQNDPTELSLGVDEILPVIRDVEKNIETTDFRKLSNYKAFNWIPFLIGQTPVDIDKSYRTPRLAPFTVSFSKRKDLLLMWTMYANNGNGICLAFDENRLICPQSGLHPMADNVFYEKDPQLYYGIIKMLHEMYLKEIQKMNLLQGIHYSKQKALIGMISAISPFIKHKSFKEEAEYRIAYYKVSDNNPNVYTRLTSRLNVINYVKVKIPLEALQYIIIGPCANYRRVRKLLIEYMKSCNIERDYAKQFIRKSKVPFRLY